VNWLRLVARFSWTGGASSLFCNDYPRCKIHQGFTIGSEEHSCVSNSLLVVIWRSVHLGLIALRAERLADHNRCPEIEEVFQSHVELLRSSNVGYPLLARCTIRKQVFSFQPQKASQSCNRAKSGRCKGPDNVRGRKTL